MGKQGYTCRLIYLSGEGELSRFKELSMDENIECAKEGYKGEQDRKVKEYNNNYYDIQYTLSLYKYEGNYYTSSYFNIRMLKTKDSEVDLIYQYNESYISYSHYFIYSSIVDLEEIDETESSSIFIEGSTCQLKYDDNGATAVLLGEKEIELYKYDEDKASNEEEAIKVCNTILDEGYGKTIYYDVIEPMESEIYNDIKEGDRILN